MTEKNESQVTAEAQVDETVDAVEEDRAPEVDLTGVMINGKRCELKKMNARQVAKLSNVFGRALMAGALEMKKLRDAGQSGGESTVIMSILAGLDDKMLIKFASALVDLDEKVVEDNFDIAWVLEALMKQIQISDINGIIRNFTLLSSQIQ